MEYFKQTRNLTIPPSSTVNLEFFPGTVYQDLSVFLQGQPKNLTVQMMLGNQNDGAAQTFTLATNPNGVAQKVYQMPLGEVRPGPNDPKEANPADSGPVLPLVASLQLTNNDTGTCQINVYMIAMRFG